MGTICNDDVNVMLDGGAGGDDGPPGAGEHGRPHARPPHQPLRHHHGLRLLPHPELVAQQHRPHQQHIPCYQHQLRVPDVPEHDPGEDEPGEVDGDCLLFR